MKYMEEFFCSTMKRLEKKLYQILLRSDGVLKEMVNRKLGNALLMKK